MNKHIYIIICPTQVQDGDTHSLVLDNLVFDSEEQAHTYRYEHTMTEETQHYIITELTKT